MADAREAAEVARRSFNEQKKVKEKPRERRVTASRQTRMDATGPTALKISNKRPSLASGTRSPTYKEAEWKGGARAFLVT